MIAEILSTGDEIRSGALVDTNSAYIAQRLEEAGVEVTRHQCVGDDMDELVAVFKEISTRANIAVVTGGLGPTTDDLSSDAAAKAIGADLVLNETALERIEAFFKTRSYPMPSSNRKQAMFPRGAEMLPNPVGTAPGFTLKIGQCRFFFMPGVPFEMYKMLPEQVLPRIHTMQGGHRKFCVIKTLSVFGTAEASIGEQVAALPVEFPGTKLGLRAKFPEIQVKIYANGDDETSLNTLVNNAAEWAKQKLDNRVFSDDGVSMQAVVGKLLARKKATVAVAESCTGGLISHWLTNVPGSSDYFLFSGVTYANEAKTNVLSVSPDTLEKYGAVHEETVKEMAEGARRIAGATYGLSTSGIAGPDGGTDEKPVGTVCIGLSTPTRTTGYRFHFPYGKRLSHKQAFAMTALNVLRQELLGHIEE